MKIKLGAMIAIAHNTCQQSPYQLTKGHLTIWQNTCWKGLLYICMLLINNLFTFIIFFFNDINNWLNQTFKTVQIQTLHFNYFLNNFWYSVLFYLSRIQLWMIKDFKCQHFFNRFNNLPSFIKSKPYQYKYWNLYHTNTDKILV